MKHRLLILICTIAVLTAGAGTAAAHERTFRTEVEALAAILKDGTNEVTVSGRVISRRAQCVANRRVKVFAVFADGSKELKGVVRTSHNGFFGIHDDFTNAVDAELRATRKNVGRGRHRHVCGAASDRFEDDDGQTPAGP